MDSVAMPYRFKRKKLMNKEWIEQERIRLEKVAAALKESIAEKIAAELN